MCTAKLLANCGISSKIFNSMILKMYFPYFLSITSCRFFIDFLFIIPSEQVSRQTNRQIFFLSHSQTLRRLKSVISYCERCSSLSGGTGRHVDCVDGADRLVLVVGKATITSGLRLRRSEVLRSLRHYSWSQSQGHHAVKCLEERDMERESA